MKKLVYHFSVTFIVFTLLSLAMSYLYSIVKVDFNFDWGYVIFSTGILSLVFVLWTTWLRHQRARHLEIFIQKLQAMQTNSTSMGQVLLRPDEEFAPLATAVNAVQQSNQQRLALLHQQSQKLAALVNNMPLGVLRINAQRQIVEINPLAFDLLQLDRRVVGQPFDNVFKTHKLVTLVNQAFTQQTDGRERISVDPYLIDISVIHFQANPREQNILVLLYDVTQLTQIQDMQADFLVNASHELRTPLTALSGFTETLLAGAKDNPETATQFLEIMQGEVDRLISLTEDILTLSRVPKTAVAGQSIHLKSLVDEILNQQIKLADKYEVTCYNEVTEDIQVWQDEQDLRRILLNLVVNAMKYNRPNGEVHIRASQNTEGMTLIVEDSGIGISSEQQARIWERFYRVDESRNQKIPGTGLGLSIVSEIVENRFGNIELTSQVGVGTTITVTLPKLIK
ncbi:ATP-binding protein [Weissella ceti]|uniref:histidine kinase n=1 Tax=Weissella ceti TaxID=759620 RepID=A0ABT3E4S1_9LACO|nr:ATP-binding protein [Weissella ceti]MCW0952882.1 ATP-binding protein [Weissella ceti]QVK12576.1 PAS domain-containing protein [Weissella ceti]